MAKKTYTELPIIGRMPSGKTKKGVATEDRNEVLTWPSVLWDQLLEALKSYPTNQSLEVMAGGILYPSGEPSATGPVKTDKASVQRVLFANMPANVYAPTVVSRDGAYTPKLMQDLLGLYMMPEHITGVVIRIL